MSQAEGSGSELLGRLVEEAASCINVQDIDAALAPRSFSRTCGTKRGVGRGHGQSLHGQAIHNFFGFAIYKRKLLDARPNPAATGRQAELDKLPTRSVPPPTIYPDQVNAVIAVALKHFDTQIANLIAFVCEGGFRFQELQFLQVGDINLEEREIILDVKKPDPHRVRAEAAADLLDGRWPVDPPRRRAARRPIHITDRLARVIGTMGLGDASDWVFMNQAGNQISENKTLCLLKRYAIEAKVLVEMPTRKRASDGRC
jgi:integrase